MSPQAGGQDPRLNRAGAVHRGLGSRPVVWGAFAVSVAVHVFFVVLYPSLFPRLDPSDAGFRVPVGTAPPEGIEVLRVIEIQEEQDTERPEVPELQPVEERTVAPGRPVTPDAPVVDFARPGITAAERLRPNLTDRRLWAPLPQQFRELTLEQREELALSGRLAEWYDSIAAVAAAEGRWTDWTFTDSDGNRWGIADGQLFLGGLALPLPVFAAPPGPARERALVDAELARQQGQMAVQQTVRERMEAIRARRDRERAADRAAQQATPQADTTDTQR